MVYDFKLLTFSFQFLLFLNMAVFKFNDIAASETHHMVMMMPSLGALINISSVAKIMFPQDLAIFQKRQRPVNRRFRDSLISALGHFKKLLGRKVAVSHEGLAQDRAPLSGELEILMSQKSRKYILCLFDQSMGSFGFKVPIRLRLVNRSAAHASNNHAAQITTVTTENHRP